MKAAIGILVVIVLLASGLTLADRVAERVASALIAQQLTQHLHLSPSAKVDIRGFPFLTQVAAGDYQEVDISIPTLTALGVTFSHLAATAKDVHLKTFMASAADIRSTSAGTIHLSGLVPLASLPLPPGLTATDSGSRLRVSGETSVFGIPISVSATEAVLLRGLTVTFRPTNMRARAGGQSFDVPASLARRLTLVVDLSGLPFHVRVTRLAVAPAGLELAGQAQNVSLAAA